MFGYKNFLIFSMLISPTVVCYLVSQHNFMPWCFKFLPAQKFSEALQISKSKIKRKVGCVIYVFHWGKNFEFFLFRYNRNSDWFRSEFPNLLLLRNYRARSEDFVKKFCHVHRKWWHPRLIKTFFSFVSYTTLPTHCLVLVHIFF